MRRFTSSRGFAANASIFALAVAAFPAAAFAQAAPTTNSQQQAQPGSQPGDTPETSRINPQSTVEVQSGQAAEADSGQGIVVTGSRIRRPNLDSPVPITSVTAEELPNQ